MIGLASYTFFWTRQLECKGTKEGTEWKRQRWKQFSHIIDFSLSVTHCQFPTHYLKKLPRLVRCNFTHLVGFHYFNQVNSTKQQSTVKHHHHIVQIRFWLVRYILFFVFCVLCFSWTHNDVDLHTHPFTYLLIHFLGFSRMFLSCFDSMNWMNRQQELWNEFPFSFDKEEMKLIPVTSLFMLLVLAVSTVSASKNLRTRLVEPEDANTHRGLSTSDSSSGGGSSGSSSSGSSSTSSSSSSSDDTPRYTPCEQRWWSNCFEPEPVDPFLP